MESMAEYEARSAPRHPHSPNCPAISRKVPLDPVTAQLLLHPRAIPENSFHLSPILPFHFLRSAAATQRGLRLLSGAFAALFFFLPIPSEAGILPGTRYPTNEDLVRAING